MNTDKTFKEWFDQSPIKDIDWNEGHIMALKRAYEKGTQDNMEWVLNTYYLESKEE